MFLGDFFVASLVFSVYVVVQIYSWFKFYLPLFLGMVMCGKFEPQYVRIMVKVVILKFLFSVVEIEVEIRLRPSAQVQHVTSQLIECFHSREFVS